MSIYFQLIFLELWLFSMFDFHGPVCIKHETCRLQKKFYKALIFISYFYRLDFSRITIVLFLSERISFDFRLEKNSNLNFWFSRAFLLTLR
jgi:hypothetical protein